MVSVDRYHSVGRRFCLLLDWGDTVMVNYPEYTGPMADWPTVSLCPGFKEAGEALYLKYRLALATNGTDSDSPLIRRALERVGISHLFSWIFCQREIGHAKPSPMFFQVIRSTLRIYDCRVLAMAGDDFDKDIHGAVESGIFGVWLNLRTQEDRRGPHYLTVHSWGEIHPLLPGLEMF